MPFSDAEASFNACPSSNSFEPGLSSLQGFFGRGNQSFFPFSPKGNGAFFALSSFYVLSMIRPSLRSYLQLPSLSKVAMSSLPSIATPDEPSVTC